MEKKVEKKVDWVADVGDIARGLRDGIENIARLVENLRVFGENKKARDEKRLKMLKDDKLVLPFPMFPELARMIGEMETSHIEFVDYVDNATMALEEVAGGLNRITSNRLFQHPLAFAQLQKWEVIDYMDKILWHIYSRGPIAEDELKVKFSPFSERMFSDCLRELKGAGEVEEAETQREDGYVERVLQVPENGQTKMSLVKMYLWKQRRVDLSGADEEMRQSFATVYMDFDRDDNDSAVFATAVAEILNEPNLALTTGAITYRFNTRFNKALEKMGRKAIKKSEERILKVLQEMERKGFVARADVTGQEKWRLNKKAFLNPEAHRASFSVDGVQEEETESGGDKEGTVEEPGPASKNRAPPHEDK
jgi:DNA-binding HxlR family transcriptional regulator